MKFFLLYTTIGNARVKKPDHKKLSHEKQKCMEGNHPTNKLAWFRKRMKFSQKQVAAILGLKNVGIISNYERGKVLPSLERALAFEIVYRVPVAYLFPNLHDPLKAKLRQREARILHLPDDPELFASNQ